jgi:hypothetical protein
MRQIGVVSADLRVGCPGEANEKGRPDAGSMTTSWWGEADLAAEPFEGETGLRQMVRDFCARMRGGPEGR